MATTHKVGVPIPVPPPVTDQEYSQWQQSTVGQPGVPKSQNTSTSTITNTLGQQVTTVPDATTPEAAQSSFANVPVIQLLSPSTAPSAWATTNPAQQIYVGTNDAVKMGHNQLIGAIADKLKIKQKKGESTQTLEEAVTAEVAQQHNVKLPNQDRVEIFHTPVHAGGSPGRAGGIVAPDGSENTYTDLGPMPIGGEGHQDPRSRWWFSGQGWRLPVRYAETTTTPIYAKQKATVDDIAQAMHISVGAGQDPWEAIATKIGVSPIAGGNAQTMQIAQAENGFKVMLNTPQAIAAFQQRLEAAGYFTDIQQSGATEEYTPGVFDIATQQAIGVLLGRTADLNKVVNGKVTGAKQSWDAVLNADTENVNANGGIQALIKSAAAKIPQATASQMLTPAVQAFQSRLGRAPTAAELQALTAQYDSQQVSKYEGVNTLTPDLNTGIVSSPGVARPTAAAAQYADQADGTEAFGHSVANAAGILANIISGSTPIAAVGAPTETVTPQ